MRRNLKKAVGICARSLSIHLKSIISVTRPRCGVATCTRARACVGNCECVLAHSRAHYNIINALPMRWLHRISVMARVGCGGRWAVRVPLLCRSGAVGRTCAGASKCHQTGGFGSTDGTIQITRTFWHRVYRTERRFDRKRALRPPVHASVINSRWLACRAIWRARARVVAENQALAPALGCKRVVWGVRGRNLFRFGLCGSQMTTRDACCAAGAGCATHATCVTCEQHARRKRRCATNDALVPMRALCRRVRGALDNVVMKA